MGKSGCKHDDDCATGAICDRFHECRIPKGGDCHSLPNMCLHGALCSDGQCQCNSEVTRTTTERCDALEKKVGGHCDDDKDKGVTSCDDPMASCINNTCRCQSSFVHDSVSLECRKGPGSLCGTKGIVCITGAVCDTTSVCAVDVGNSCAGDRNGNCRIGSVCDIDEVCQRMPGSSCTRNDECVAGASCNEADVCDCTEGVSKQVGISCVPVDGIVGGKCGNGDTCEDQFAVCNHDSGNCECQEGYTADPSRLTCARYMGRRPSVSGDNRFAVWVVIDTASGVAGQVRRGVTALHTLCTGLTLINVSGFGASISSNIWRGLSAPSEAAASYVFMCLDRGCLQKSVLRLRIEKYVA
ncbi:uncharacterized protein LOC143294229 [Babylonia areolata]|uniref:uncharacterized protein LOC143294229 n=1 Tax=Babylonia areolata TaxID=304850 RepID=UPI003FD53612